MATRPTQFRGPSRSTTRVFWWLGSSAEAIHRVVTERHLLSWPLLVCRCSVFPLCRCLRSKRRTRASRWKSVNPQRVGLKGFLGGKAGETPHNLHSFLFGGIVATMRFCSPWHVVHCKSTVPKALAKKRPAGGLSRQDTGSPKSEWRQRGEGAMQTEARSRRLDAVAAHPLAELLACPPATGSLLTASARA